MRPTVVPGGGGRRVRPRVAPALRGRAAGWARDRPGPPWPAPYAAAPVDAVVRVPGSKSVTNRALVLAALADGPTRLRDPLRARDTVLMAAALRVLGVGVADDGADWVVTPAPLARRRPRRRRAGRHRAAVRPAGGRARGRPGRLRRRPARPGTPAGPARARPAPARRRGRRRDGLPLTVHGAGHLPGGDRRRRRVRVQPVRVRAAARRAPVRRGASGSGTPAPARCRARCRSA